jgi:hypothetical protein
MVLSDICLGDIDIYRLFSLHDRCRVGDGAIRRFILRIRLSTKQATRDSQRYTE